jgi:hypothetical protein
MAQIIDGKKLSSVVGRGSAVSGANKKPDILFVLYTLAKLILKSNSRVSHFVRNPTYAKSCEIFTARYR